MSNKSNLCILIWDEIVEAAFIDRSMLGTQIKFVERLPLDETVFEAIAELIIATDKTPSRVTLCIPRGHAIQRTLRYPAAAKAEIGNMIQFEAARHVPLPEEDRLLAYAAVDSADETEVVLNLVAARRAEVQELIGRFGEAGVPVDEAVPFSSLAAGSLAGTPTLLVLSDAQSIELCLYGQGLLQDSQFIQRDAPGFSEERLVSAARQMAAKHKGWLGDEGICRIISGGPVPLEETAEANLGTAFGLHVHPFEMPEELAGLAVDHIEAEILLAASIEMEPTLNLIGDQQRKVPISKRTILISALVLLLTAEVIGAFTLKATAPARQRNKVAEEVNEMKRDTADVQEMRSNNRVFRKQLYQLERVCNSRASSMEILKEISDALPEDTYLRQLSCSHEEIKMKGYSKEPDKLPELVMAMPFVDTISTSEIGTERDDYYEFTLSASLRR